MPVKYNMSGSLRNIDTIKRNSGGAIQELERVVGNINGSLTDIWVADIDKRVAKIQMDVNVETDIDLIPGYGTSKTWLHTNANNSHIEGQSYKSSAEGWLYCDMLDHDGNEIYIDVPPGHRMKCKAYWYIDGSGWDNAAGGAISAGGADMQDPDLGGSYPLSRYANLYWPEGERISSFCVWLHMGSDGSSRQDYYFDIHEFRLETTSGEVVIDFTSRFCWKIYNQ